MLMQRGASQFDFCNGAAWAMSSYPPNKLIWVGFLGHKSLYPVALLGDNSMTRILTAVKESCHRRSGITITKSNQSSNVF